MFDACFGVGAGGTFGDGRARAHRRRSPAPDKRIRAWFSYSPTGACVSAAPTSNSTCWRSAPPRRACIETRCAALPGSRPQTSRISLHRRPRTIPGKPSPRLHPTMTDDCHEHLSWEPAIRAALQQTWDEYAGGDLLDVFMSLARHLRARGIHPEPGPVFDWALEISRGISVADLDREPTCPPPSARTAGRRRAEVRDADSRRAL